MIMMYWFWEQNPRWDFLAKPPESCILHTQYSQFRLQFHTRTYRHSSKIEIEGARERCKLPNGFRVESRRRKAFLVGLYFEHRKPASDNDFGSFSRNKMFI